MTGFYPLASGSKGNCIYLNTGEAKILIDAGISARSIASRLQEVGASLDEIEAVLVTHEHHDHIQGLRVLAYKMGIPVFANTETAHGIVEAFQDCPKFKIFTTGETFAYANMVIHPFSIQHDTLDPVAFTIKTCGLKLGFCTDLGFVTSLVKHQLQLCDALYIEANHQPSMVHASARPSVYKQRVLSRSGHLSNEACGELLCHIAHDGLQHVHLAHLSSECNEPAIALKTIHSMLAEQNITLNISIAHQDRVSTPFLFAPKPAFKD